MRYAVIVAGGAGTRLWPLSRGARPKQLLSVQDGRSLLRLAYERLRGLLPADRVYVCTGAAHAAAVHEHLPELPPGNVLGEPVGRDTASAIGLAAAVVRRRDPDAVLASVTADQVIEPVESFCAALRTGFEAVDADPAALVTFGIAPTSPHTGLGYIAQGEPLDRDPRVLAVRGFTEKPDAETAQRYVRGGCHLWNSGMFVWRADTVLAELATYVPGSHEALTRAATAWDTPDRDRVLAAVYPGLPRISIDYAVLEPAAAAGRVVVVPMAVDWLDVGSWPALAGTLDRDPDRNALAAVTVLVDSAGNIVVSDDPDHLVATVGLTETIIVHTRDVTMVCPKSAAERVKDLAARVTERHGERYA